MHVNLSCACCYVLDKRHENKSELARAVARWTKDPFVRSACFLGYEARVVPVLTKSDRKDHEDASISRTMEEEDTCHDRHLLMGDICGAVRKALSRLGRMEGDVRKIVLTCTGSVDPRVLRRPEALQMHGRLVKKAQASIDILLVGSEFTSSEREGWKEIANVLNGRRDHKMESYKVIHVSWEDLSEFRFETGGDRVIAEEPSKQLLPVSTPCPSPMGYLPTCSSESHLLEGYASVKKRTAIAVVLPGEGKTELVPVSKLNRLVKAISTPLLEFEIGRLGQGWRYQGVQKKPVLVPDGSRGMLTLCYRPDGGIQLLSTMRSGRALSIEEVVGVPPGCHLDGGEIELHFLEEDSTQRSCCLRIRRDRFSNPISFRSPTFYFWLAGKDVMKGREDASRLVRMLECPPSLSETCGLSMSLLHALKKAALDAEGVARQQMPSPQAHEPPCDRTRSLPKKPEEVKRSVLLVSPARPSPFRKGFLCAKKALRSGSSGGHLRAWSSKPREEGIHPVEPRNHGLIMEETTKSQRSSATNACTIAPKKDDRIRWESAKEGGVGMAKEQVKSTLSSLPSYHLPPVKNEEPISETLPPEKGARVTHSSLSELMDSFYK